MIFDAYRPKSVQYKFWELQLDECYVANPAKGSRHNKRAAVDVALADFYGNILEMPTDYDDFSEKAHVNAKTQNKFITRVNLLNIKASFLN